MNTTPLDMLEDITELYKRWYTKTLTPADDLLVIKYSDLIQTWTNVSTNTSIKEFMEMIDGPSTPTKN